MTENLKVSWLQQGMYLQTSGSCGVNRYHPVNAGGCSRQEKVKEELSILKGNWEVPSRQKRKTPQTHYMNCL